LLGRDFHYRVFERTLAGHPMWATTSTATATNGVPSCVRAPPVYNGMAARQAYLQLLLKQALATIGFKHEAERSTQFSYEMVALSHATAKTLGYENSESSGKPFVEVSGRKGLGVKADDLLNRLVESAGREVGTRN